MSYPAAQHRAPNVMKLDFMGQNSKPSGPGRSWHNSVTLAFGGGLCSLSTSSFLSVGLIVAHCEYCIKQFKMAVRRRFESV